MKKILPTLLTALAAFSMAPATAAMYRCGNAFQDRPCDDGSQQQTIRPGRGAGAAPAASAAARPAVKAASQPASAKP
jgi:hypothetical protein